MNTLLQLTKQFSNVEIKLNRAIDILSKVRHNSNLDILEITYHSLFGSHLASKELNFTKPNPNASK